MNVKVFRQVEAQRDDAHVEIARLIRQLERVGKQLQTLRTSSRNSNADNAEPDNTLSSLETKATPRKRGRPKGATCA